ncbi:MAG: hypothetical protein JSU96_21260 [Acidobacteriota bacterium]|nr:MAG: hypothetical protein JSU96_21260 [Acidobacteriota bacterium]
MNAGNPTGTKPLVATATAVAFLMIANQIAGKATRDALFLSNFDVTSLPLLIIAASIVSMAAVFLFARLITRVGPPAFVPTAFAVSAILLLGQWVLAARLPGAAAIAVYIHFAVFGSVLVSSFWSLINEKFDPRTGKKIFSQIATGATVGGLVGGVVAERVAALLTISAMLPVLALMHLICALLLLLSPHLRVARSGRRIRTSAAKPSRSGLQILKTQPYLRLLAALVLLGTVGATLIDYVFKAQASSTFTSGESLLRFFAVFYTGAGLLTVVLQGWISKLLLQRFGLVKTVATLPAATGLTALGAFVWPGLGSIILARAAEVITRNSLYRSAYELLYTPLPNREKRPTKTLIDVGFERLGDALGGGLIRGLLLLGPAIAHPVMLVIAAVIGAVSLLVAYALNRGYISTLERNLKNRAVELSVSEVDDDVTRTVVLSVANADLDQSFVFNSPIGGSVPKDISPDRSQQVQLDPVVDLFIQVRAGNRKAITDALRKEKIDRALIPPLIDLLTRDELALEVIRGLRKQADRCTGQLLDALLDRRRPEAVRRRVPRILGGSLTQRSAEGLLLGMDDPKFEVRFQCGRAMAYITQKNPSIRLQQDRVYAAVLNEVHVKQAVWQSHHLLDQIEGDSEKVDFFVDELVKDRANRSLEHVFTLLSLVLPRDPLTIAYRGIHSHDRNLRGTALEYLERVLPSEIRTRLWPFLEWEETRQPQAKSRDEILKELIDTDQSIQLSLEELRKLRDKG